MSLRFVFDAELFPWTADKASWVFASLPVDDAAELREDAPMKGGFGSVRVVVEVGGSRWKTSIFPDKANDTYVLPIKKDVRRAEQIGVGDVVRIDLEVL